jgi:AraC-like DNA-binding protein
MSDFASAAMLRVIHAGMRRLGMDSPVQQWLRSATVPLNAKRQLVEMVILQLGVDSLLELGQGVHDVEDGSLLNLLVHKGQPLRVMQAWQRLERFVHSRHRLQQTVIDSCTIEHRHISLVDDTKPSAAEDLVVLGVLIALLERADCINVVATLENGLTVWPIGNVKALSLACQSGSTSLWRLTWDVPEVVTEKRNPTHPPQSVNFSTQIETWLKINGTEAISIEQLAQHCCLSVRSLQRHLKNEGVRFVDVIAKVRTERAAQLLSSGQTSLAEIGFVSGYTDQAHFCRDFKRHIGFSPQQYRLEHQF